MVLFEKVSVSYEMNCLMAEQYIIVWCIRVRVPWCSGMRLLLMLHLTLELNAIYEAVL